MNRRFDLKGWGPILAAAVFGFVLGASGVSIFWPQMWEGAKLSDSLGFWGGIFGGAMTLIAAIIAFRPARDQMLIARAANISAEINELERISGMFASITNGIQEHIYLEVTEIPSDESNKYTFNIDNHLLDRIELIRRSAQTIYAQTSHAVAAACKFQEMNSLQDAIDEINNVSFEYYTMSMAACLQATRREYHACIRVTKMMSEDFLSAVECANSEIRKTISSRSNDLKQVNAKLGPH